MPTSDAKKRAAKKWNDANRADRYDYIGVLAPKGQKAIIAQAAQASGESVSQYILTAVQARLDSEQNQNDE